MSAAGSKTDVPHNPGPSIDRELEFLIHCARATIEPQRADRMRELAAAEIDWDRVLTLAQRNGLSPLLFFHLNQICPPSLPVAKLDLLRDYFQKNSAFCVLLTAELVRLLRLLDENGIKAIPYKGPAIATMLYGNLSLRQFCDLDILVRKSDVWKASELFEAQGFQPHFVIPENKRDAFVRLSYVQMFRRDAGRTVIELHWGIAPRFFCVQFEADDLWQRLQRMTLQSTTVFTPCPEDLLLMLCVHGGKDCWEKLEWVCAIAELLRSHTNLDWQRVQQVSREMHCRRMLVFGVLLAHELFDIQIPTQLEAEARSARLRSMAEEVRESFSADKPPARTFSRRVAFHLRLKDSAADRVRHCLRLAATTTPVDWSTATLPGPLSFAYPLLRAIRLTRKYGLNNQQARS